MPWLCIEKHISNIENQKITIIKKQPVSGGCINETLAITTSNNTNYFIKLNSANNISMFKAELEALDALANCQSIRVPKAFSFGSEEKYAFLILEYLPLEDCNNRNCQYLLGQQLAKLHQQNPLANSPQNLQKTSAEAKFGWHRDNTIGTTKQNNTWSESWIEFYRDRRLRYQFSLAESNGLSIEGADTLLDNLEVFFEDYEPSPSLLHGDLWGGNIGAIDNIPVIFDPASYIGDRETDIALTELFGGFSEEFYRGYNLNFKLNSGYRKRKNLYNLYHILNHFVIFGGGYGRQAQTMVNSLINNI